MFIPDEISQIYPNDDPDQKQTVPLLGSIATGLPTEIVEWQGESVQVPPAMVASNGKYFALRVQGDSMLGANIAAGDIAVFRQVVDWRLEVRNREIVAAAVAGERSRLFLGMAKRIVATRKPSLPRRVVAGRADGCVAGFVCGVVKVCKERGGEKGLTGCVCFSMVN